MPVFMVLLGAALLALGFWARNRANIEAKASLNWPTVPGTITMAGVQRREAGTAEAGKTTYLVFVAGYSYAVNGTMLQGHWESGDTKRFDELQKIYSAGAAVSVHYNPAKPKHTTLEPTEKVSSSIAMLGFIFGAIALVIGLLMFTV